LVLKLDVVGFLRSLMVWLRKCRRFRITKLSSYDQFGRSYKPWYYYCLAYFLYTLLPTVIQC